MGHYFGYGIIVDMDYVYNNYVDIDLSGTCAKNILNNLSHFTYSRDFTISHLKIGDYVIFSYDIFINEDNTQQCYIYSMTLSVRLQSALRFYYLYKHLRKKRLIEFVFHPSNVCLDTC